MKTKFLFLTIYLIFITQLKAEKIPGYYLTGKLDTVRVAFDIPIVKIYKDSDIVDYHKLQSQVWYFDSYNVKNVLKPNLAMEYSFEFAGKRIRMISFKGIPHYDDKFLRLLIDGKLKLFGIYAKMGNTYPIYYNAVPRKGWSFGGIRIWRIDDLEFDAYLLLKNKVKTFFIRGTFPFRDDLIDYLSDCPKLTKKIKETEYHRADIPMIVKEYNTTCNK